MMRFQMPPGRTSIECVVVVKPRGPHHRPTCSGSVQASKTSAGGAANTRVKTSSRSDSRCVVTVLLLLLHPAQVLIEPVEALLPEPAVVLHPAGDLLQRPGDEPARSPLGVAAAGDQAGRLQHLEVLGDRRQ